MTNSGGAMVPFAMLLPTRQTFFLVDPMTLGSRILHHYAISETI